MNLELNSSNLTMNEIIKILEEKQPILKTYNFDEKDEYVYSKMDIYKKY